MNIQPVNSYSNHSIRQYPYRILPYGTVQFRSKTKIIDELAANNKNPIVRYANNVFKRSLVASARNITPISSELKPITREVAIESTPQESTYAWDIENKKSDKYVIYLHGASQNITNIQNLYKSIINETDFSVLALEYRGFGKNNPKKVNSQTFLEDTLAATNYLKKDKKVKEENIFVIGHSMGTYPASILANKKPGLGRLILVAPLGSVASQPLDVNLWFAKRMSPFVRFLFKNFKILRAPLANFFKIEKHLQQTQVPTDIIHAQNDRLIKYTSSQNMAKLCPNLHSFTLLKQGGHKMENHKINSIISLLRGE